MEAVKNEPFALRFVQAQTHIICITAMNNWYLLYRFVKIELPIEFLLEKYYQTTDPDFQKWIESQPNWINYHKTQIMTLLKS